jgi:hypothetical protein
LNTPDTSSNGIDEEGWECVNSIKITITITDRLYCELNGILHLVSIPEHLPSCRLAEPQEREMDICDIQLGNPSRLLKLATSMPMDKSEISLIPNSVRNIR